MNRKIDTLRLRVLHTKCMTVSEIAEAMGTSPEEVADKLRELGYAPIFKRDVPEKNTYINKEENTMARGQKTSPEKKEEVKVLRAEGKSQREISEITGVPQTTVHRICSAQDQAKEEPAPSANDTSSKETISITIVPENSEDVNPRGEISAEKAVPDAVMEACRRMREDELAKIDALLDEIKFRRGRVNELEKFLEVRK